MKSSHGLMLLLFLFTTCLCAKGNAESVQYEIAGHKRQAMERYGTSAGANVLLTVLPQDEVTIILLGNTNGVDLGEFRLAIARACIR